MNLVKGMVGKRGRGPLSSLPLRKLPIDHGSAWEGISKVSASGTTSILAGKEPRTSPSASTKIGISDPLQARHSTE